MISIAIAMLIGIQAQQPDSTGTAKQDAAAILGRMFQHYADAKTLKGKILMTQTANGVSVHVDTELQYDRPSMLYLWQRRDGGEAGHWLITSDGKEFSYDPPNGQNAKLYGSRRHVEYVSQHNDSQNLGDLVEAAGRSLGDPNPILESAIAAKVRLKRLLAQWATLKFAGRESVNGKEVMVIKGDYRDDSNSPVAGEFEADVTDSGDFVRYILHQKIELKLKEVDSGPIDVTTEWDADLKVGSETDPKLYRVVT